ncbi:MAG: metallophosphoesterase [Bacteroidales bacterium]|nr:metallophosphoesterase [Bacteroidales bacterium]
MKIQYCSDLHIEFPQNKKYLKDNPIKPIGDVLLLAGDIVVFTELEKHKDFFKYLSDNFRQTYWVPGNHEYYHSNIVERSGSFSENILPNLTLANNMVFDEQGVKILLSTLWSKIRDRNHGMVEYNMNDFRVIRHNGWKLTADIFNKLHESCLKFITEELTKEKPKKTIVLTHHIPTYLNYPERFRNDILNDAFAVELYDLIHSDGPDYWIYGHHHQRIPDFDIGKTKLVNNQLGYVHMKESDGFELDKVVDLTE